MKSMKWFKSTSKNPGSPRAEEK